MRWWGPLVLLAAIRIAIPLAAVADEGSSLPGLPAFVRARGDGGLTGDATGFYAATREFMAAWGRMPRAVLALDALFAVAAAAALVVLWRRRPELRAWVAAAALFAFGLVVAVDVHWMKASGAAVFGWPLLWALPMTVYRALGFGLSEARRVGLRRRALARDRRADGRRRRLSRPQRDRPPPGRPACGGVLDGVAGARRPRRRPRRVGERPVGGRRRPPQLQRAAVDPARDGGRGARPVAPPHAASARTRRLRAQRRNARQGVERAARCSRAHRRPPARTLARRASLPGRSALARAARRRLLAALVPEALRQPAVMAERSLRPRPHRHDAGRIRRSSIRARSRSSCRSRSSARSRCAGRGRSRSCSRSCSSTRSSTASTRTRRMHPRFLYASLPELFVLWAGGLRVLAGVRR